MTSSFSKWYAKPENRAELSRRRKEKYQQDPDYRRKVIERSASRRINERGPLPEGFTYHMEQAAEQVGVTIWTLREWRKKNYFPEPPDYLGKLWFSQSQVNLLGQLREFFEVHGRRVGVRTKPMLEDLVSLIYSNW